MHCAGFEGQGILLASLEFSRFLSCENGISVDQLQAEHGCAAYDHYPQIQGWVEAACAQQTVAQAVYAVGEGIKVRELRDIWWESIDWIKGAGEEEKWVEDEAQDKTKAISVF